MALSKENPAVKTSESGVSLYGIRDLNVVQASPAAMSLGSLLKMVNSMTEMQINQADFQKELYELNGKVVHGLAEVTRLAMRKEAESMRTQAAGQIAGGAIGVVFSGAGLYSLRKAYNSELNNKIKGAEDLDKKLADIKPMKEVTVAQKPNALSANNTQNPKLTVKTTQSDTPPPVPARPARPAGWEADKARTIDARKDVDKAIESGDFSKTMKSEDVANTAGRDFTGLPHSTEVVKGWRTSLNKNLSEWKSEKSTAMHHAAGSAQAWSGFGQGLSQVVQGTTGVAAADMKEAQADRERDKAIYQANQQLIQGLLDRSNQTNNNIESSRQALQQIRAEIASVNRA